MNAPLMKLNENVDVATQVRDGKVILTWYGMRDHIVYDAQNAFDFAEHIARMAHKARFPGTQMPANFSYLAQQIKQRLTDELRDRLVLRIRAMLPSLIEKGNLDYASLQVVDTIFSAVDAEGNNRL